MTRSTNATAESAGTPSTIDADTRSLTRAIKTGIGDGHVVIHDKESTLQADHVKYDLADERSLGGWPCTPQPGRQEWVAPSMYYNFDTRALKTAQADGFVDPLFVRTEIFQPSGYEPLHLRPRHGHKCDYDQPDYRFEATHGEIWPVTGGVTTSRCVSETRRLPGSRW